MSVPSPRIALDTNVLVRFLVADDVAQSRDAAALIERTIDAGETLFISDIVVCETVWVLAAAYKVPRDEIGGVLRELLRARHLVFSQADLLARALSAFNSGKGDYADYLIREQAFEAGCEIVVTFDRALLRDEGFAAPA